MNRYRVTALQPVEISVTIAGSEQPQIVKLEAGETRGGVRIVHRVMAVEGSERVDIVPHPEEVGAVVAPSGLLEIERIPNWRTDSHS